MLMRTAGALPLAALLVLAGMPVSATLAKPPGLPLKQKDACLEKAPQQEVHSEAVVENTAPGNSKEPDEKGVKPPATIVFELGIDSGTGVFSGMAAAQGTANSETTPAQELGEGWSQLFGLLGGNSGLFVLEITAALPVERAPASKPATELIKQWETLGTIRALWDRINDQANISPLSACPYMRARETTPPAAAEPMATSVLDNLGKIEAARKLYDEAEKERLAGHFHNACRAYQAAQKLCPGSRWQEQASARLAEMQAAQAEGEEEEEQPVDWWPKGIQMHGKVRLAGISVTVNLKENGHGSLSFGYEMLLGLAWDSALMPLFNFAP
jgi:hypothetical protein